MGLMFLSCLPARAQTTNVWALITFTNTLNGATNHQTITGNGSVRTYTNTITASPSTLIQATNRSGWAATNTWLHLIANKFPGTDRISLTNTNQVLIQGTINNALTVTLSANLGTVTYATQVWSSTRSVQYPPMGLLTEAGRTNNSSGLIEIMNDGRATNAIANGNPSLSNLLDRTSQQTSSNKVFLAPTNIGGLGDGNRFTNAVSFGGSNGTIHNLRLTHATIAGFTNASGTNGAFTNIVMDLATLYHVLLTNGVIGNLTNGTLWFTTVSNGIFNGTLTAVTNGFWTNGIANSLTITNLILEGNFFSTAGGYQHLKLGSNNVAQNDYAVLVGFENTGGYSTVLVGNGNLDYSSTGGNSVLGLENFIGTNAFNISVVGTGNVFTNRDPGSIEKSSALGNYNLITNSWVTIIGSDGRSTVNNQVIFPGATNAFVIEGALVLSAGATNFQTLAGSTNTFRGDIAFPRGTYTAASSSGAHNTIELNTNVFLDVTGSPSAAWPIGGISGGNRNGKWAMIRNQTGYEATIWSNDGSITAANRISTLTGTNTSWPSGSFALFIYDSSASRWLLQAPPMTTITAAATNAIAFLEGFGTNTTFYGLTNVLGFTNAGQVNLGGALRVSGPATNMGPEISQWITVTNGISYATRLTAGVGGFTTNIVLASTNAHTYVSGATNISVRHVVGSQAGRIDFWSVSITNVSGSDKTLEFSSITNAWHFSGAYGTNHPSNLTNGFKLFLSAIQDGTNIDAGYTYFKFP